jgi:AcrR family transcriptional regulator
MAKGRSRGTGGAGKGPERRGGATGTKLAKSTAKRTKRTPRGGAATAARSAEPASGGRKVDQGARRQAILDAALAAFAERGFEAARLEDVARRAGVAKGTLYLYFEDKQALFENLLRSSIDPIFERVEAVSAVPDLPVAQALEILCTLFRTLVLATERKHLIRLIVAEGPRFPAIAEFYYRNVVARMLPLIRRIAARAAERGELPNDALARFPQLAAGPLLLAVLWEGMFAEIDPLDVESYLRAYCEMIAGVPRRDAS